MSIGVFPKYKRPLTLVLGGIALVLVFTASSPGCDGGDPTYITQKIEEAAYPRPPLWSPDGQQIVFNADQRIYSASVDGSRLYLFPHGGEFSLEHAWSISPDGLIALTSYQRGDYFEIETALLDGSERRLLAEEYPLGPYHPAWSPDGTRLAFVGMANLETPDGQKQSFRTIYTVNREGSDVRHYERATPPMMLYNEPATWSPDGRHIALLLWDCHRDGEELCPVYIEVINVDTSEAMRVSETVSRPAWSPDSSRIAFIQSKNGVETIATIRPDGSDLREVASLPEAVSQAAVPTKHWPLPGSWGGPWRRWMSWSPDGSEIRLHWSPFVTVDVDGSNLRIMWARRASQAEWSPDGSRIAVLLPDGPLGVRLFSMASDGSDKRVLVRWDEVANNRWEAAHGSPPPDALDWMWTSPDDAKARP